MAGKKNNKNLNAFASTIICIAWIGGVLLSSAYGKEEPIVVVVLSADIKPYRDSIDSFYKSFRSKGGYRIKEFVMGNNGSEQNIGDEISRLDPALIVTVGTSATKRVKERFAEIPIVFSMVLNPVDSGIVARMDRPGGNITGVSMDIPPAKQFEYMKKLSPSVKKIGLVYSEAETGIFVKSAKKAAESAGLELIAIAVSGPGEVPGALEKLKSEADMLWSVADSNVLTRVTIREVLLFTLKQKIPFIGLSSSFVKAGALAAVESSPASIGAETAILAEKVLNGANPGAMNVVTPESGLVVNGNTADLIGLSVNEKLEGLMEVIRP